MKRRAVSSAHAPGLLAQMVEAVRGKRQKLVRPSENHPLLLLRYPPGGELAARELEGAYTHTYGALRSATRELYAGVLERLPSLVVVELRAHNPCTCLGHHHPRGTESRYARRLAAEWGSAVGEIDLAYESIRGWQPQPLSALAARLGESGLEESRYRIALLAVLLHELEHLANPDLSEQAVRGRSNDFYAMALAEVVADASGAPYGIASPPRP